MRQIKQKRLLILSTVLLLCTYITQAQVEYSVDEALKVFSFIEKIIVEKDSGNSEKMRSVTVTESELNSYIAYRIDTEKEDVMKQLHLKIFKRDRIEGKILLDLRGQNLPDFLRPEMNLYFAGKVEVKDQKVRLLIKKLYIEDQPIRPEILDVVIFIASKIQSTEPTSIYDWYDLPFGIKDIKSQDKKAIFYY